MLGLQSTVSLFATRLINPIIHIYRMTLKDFEIAFFVWKQ